MLQQTPHIHARSNLVISNYERRNDISPERYFKIQKSAQGDWKKAKHDKGGVGQARWDKARWASEDGVGQARQGDVRKGGVG